MRSSRQEADIGGVATVDIRVRDAGEDRKVLAVILKNLEVRRRRVVMAFARGEELRGQQAEVVANAEHAAWDATGLRAKGSHRVEKG